MLVRLGPIISDGRGSIGGSTLSRNGSGPYFRARVKPVNPQTIPQVGIRSAMSVVSDQWVNTLTPEQRKAWEDYALGTPLPNGLGDPINIGGRQMFLRSNVARQFVGIGSVFDAPVTPGVAEVPITIYTGDTSNGIEAGVISPALTGADLVSITIGIAVNQTVNFFDTPYTFALGVVAATGFPVLVKAAADVAIGQRWFLQARFFQENGRVSFTARDQVDILT